MVDAFVVLCHTFSFFSLAFILFPFSSSPSVGRLMWIIDDYQHLLPPLATRLSHFPLPPLGGFFFFFLLLFLFFSSVGLMDGFLDRRGKAGQGRAGLQGLSD
ncbi:hypothetical protein IWX49DRAFT_425619 [Phyllosticta citricarpa]